MKFHLISLGCQMNISDSERVKTMLLAMGFSETDDPKEADLLGVMACSVRQRAIDKIYSLIHRWNIWKQSRPLITFVSGCILPLDREKFLTRFDLLFTINELPQLPEMLKQYGVQTGFSINSVQDESLLQEAIERTTNKALLNKPEYATDHPVLANDDIDDSHLQVRSSIAAIQATAPSRTKSTTQNKQKDVISTLSSDASKDISRGFWQIAPSYSSSYEAYVTIQNGCDKFCTFCAVPYTRGREVSRASSEILQEVYALMKQGFKTITLLGQNVNSYGLDCDNKELSFAQLLERVGNMAEELKHDCWVYFTSPHPRDMSTDVIKTVAKYPALAKQIHLPIQSGDDKLLIKMNRQHSISKYRQVVKDIKTYIPQATIFTDIIVGFCGETEEQFANTALAMEEFEYNMAYIALYSPRPGAASSRWNDDVPLDIKKTRYRTLSEILKRSSAKYNRSIIGQSITILVDKVIFPKADAAVQKAVLSGRNEGKIPARIVLSDSVLADSSCDNFLQQVVGYFVQVKVVGTHSLSLECMLDSIPEEFVSHTIDFALNSTALSLKPEQALEPVAKGNDR